MLRRQLLKSQDVLYWSRGSYSWLPLRALKPLCLPALWFMQIRRLRRSPLPGQPSIIHFLWVPVTMQICALLNSPEGLCLSLFLPHSLPSASIQPMNGQGFNYSPHLSDQIQLENEGNPRQALSFLCNILHGRDHPALSSREYFPLMVSWPFWKIGIPAFGDPLLGFSRCVWPLQMLINLPDDALSIREPFIPPGLLMTNMNARKFFLAFPDPVLRFVCPLLLPPSSNVSPHDRLTTHITRSTRVWQRKGGGPQERSTPTRFLPIKYSQSLLLRPC